ncbi:hypothetical protein [Fulvivirga sediminis]|uniref:Uncharacterized protein n=1 Tax=Fulvivirga sediminis TaxID=2803949 RepID=A0A937K1J4_9BACT|nr:hypothetical protein [Fulvivirga sediminis]MBL3658674.1 hypothetical protein [Fulvivirga sediminis]
MKASSFAQQLKSLNIVHWAIALPMVLGGLAIFSLNMNQPAIAPGQTIDYLIYLPLLAMVVILPISNIIYTQMLKKHYQKPLSVKFKAYKSAFIIRDSFFEIPGILTCIIAYILGNSFILIIIPAILLQFYSNRPVLKKISYDLRLTPDQEKEILA